MPGWLRGHYRKKELGDITPKQSGHNEARFRKQKSFFCPSCPLSFPNEQEYRKHYKEKHHPPQEILRQAVKA